jgi:chromosome segregation protein
LKITRLRLLGFKSFVEPTELLIEPGLTGVVGPNGCGKSNLLEAIRWVMGETSFKSMRGAGMDDVIFAGTQSRPARNMSEVTVFIDNAERTAPAEFNDADVLEVTRRIEREAGSAYKINGKDVRARDVRLLFEDAATGARSPALVRQGRIGEIVNAKPQERRRLLEDAAGITGLHSRRHEAELRLNASESNLERLEDLQGQLDVQLKNLKRQARQARRYKSMSSKIREAEALKLHMNWTAACEAVSDEETSLQEALREVARLTQSEAEALRGQNDGAEALAPLRDQEANRAAGLQRLAIERDTLEQEEARAKARCDELEIRANQLETDIARERGILEESQDLLAGLHQEEQRLKQAISSHGEREEDVRAEAGQHAVQLAEAEAKFNELAAQLAEARARRNRFEAEFEDAHERIARLERRAETIAGELGELETSAGAGSDETASQAEVARLQQAFRQIEGDLEAAEAKLAKTRGAEDDAREARSKASLKAQQCDTELETLTHMLEPAGGEQWVPVIDAVKVRAGFELALGAALGDDLDASIEQKAPAHWSLIGGSGGESSLPSGAEALSTFVSAPKELTRRLDQIGVVERSGGSELQAELKPGQRLVSREGDLWRWDGFSATADAPSAAAKRLAGRNRLRDLQHEAQDARAALDAAEQALSAATAGTAEAEAREKQLRQAWRAAQSELDQARDALAEAARSAQASTKQLGALQEARTQTEEALGEARDELHEAETALADMGDSDQLETDLDRHRESLTEIRSAHASAQAGFEALQRELRDGQERIDAIDEDRERWLNRQQSAAQQIETLGARIEETGHELEELTKLPGDVAERRSRLLDEISKAEMSRQAAADALAEAETLLRAREKTLREAQSELAEAREERARIEARLEAARERRTEQVRQIQDQLGCSAEDCREIAGLKLEAPLPSTDEIETRLAKLKAERERLGGVNLRAEEEAEELAEEIASMESERDDLEQAIHRLRQGISSLNREGRKRLLEAFDEVNEHFKKLFQTLFAGGEAELQLVESDDPLESGLEILAQPPGKKPQVLTLLSGGEKALTALALIFAVFLTNPSPICVLDEVDAPLDDANVERFCTMMDEMARATDTRFMIITHHPFTMSRVDRLFGVTMAERGISQLVSVDLQTAEAFRATA